MYLKIKQAGKSDLLYFDFMSCCFSHAEVFLSIQIPIGGNTVKMEHPLEPAVCRSSEILILGSFPSVQSRKLHFYYANPRNRFWKVLAAVYHLPEPFTLAEKHRFLRDNRIALWDVVGSCDIRGSADQSIRQVKPNPIGDLLEEYPIRRLFANGKTAYQLYMRYIFPNTGAAIIPLPSTSPANAAFSLQRLTRVWQEAFADNQDR